MEMIKTVLTKIGGPVWRLAQTTKHSTIGAIVVIVVVAAVIWVAA